MLSKVLRNSKGFGNSTAASVDHGLDTFDTPFDLANTREILIQFPLIRRAQFVPELTGILGDEIQNALAIPLSPGTRSSFARMPM